jgi:plasmid stabilization system protein ParE
LRSDLPSLRSYLVLYRIVGDGVEIVRVVHAARNLDDLV